MPHSLHDRLLAVQVLQATRGDAVEERDRVVELHLAAETGRISGRRGGRGGSGGGQGSAVY